MSAELPRRIQFRLEQTLGQWRQWQCDPPLQSKPALVERLTGGLSNYSFKVRAHGDYVVRIDGVNPQALGLNRQCEWRTLQDAHDAGLAPCPRYFNPDLGALVLECTDMPPFAHAIQERVALPVFDLTTLAGMVHDAVYRLPYGGVMPRRVPS